MKLTPQDRFLRARAYSPYADLSFNESTSFISTLSLHALHGPFHEISNEELVDMKKTSEADSTFSRSQRYTQEKARLAGLGAFIFLARLSLGEALFDEEFKRKHHFLLISNSLFTVLFIALLVIPEREALLKKVLIRD